MVYKTVPLTESQVGKYIDINGDGIPEGVIFADLTIGGAGEYGDRDAEHNGIYSIPAENNLKDYAVIGEYEDKINGKQEMLTPVLDGEDRFYIMALKDFGDGMFTWYTSAYNKIEDYSTITKPDFGAGKQNTINMIKKWNSAAYGRKSLYDIWNIVQNKVAEGWFVPSFAEWKTFGNAINLNYESVKNKGMESDYWLSSMYNSYMAYYTYANRMGHSDVSFHHHIRLAKTI